jgi:uncharacterized protein YndB with AHSA1/START domain
MAYEYHSHWRIDAPIETVWAALTEVEAWPHWWPFVKRVQTLRRGEPSGLGAVRRIEWGSRLPYGFTLDVECTEVQRLKLLRGSSRGHLEGEGVWMLAPLGGDATEVRYTWRLAVNRPWMKLTAPLMAPVFRWNHEGVMHGGERGLAQHLARAGGDSNRLPTPA